MSNDGSSGSGEDRITVVESTVREETFEPTVGAIRAARRFVVAAAPAGAGPEDVARMALGTSELASNAVMHAHSPFTVRVTTSAEWVHIAVRDLSPTLPAIRDPSASDVTGRGLAIVEAVASRWGVDVAVDASGKWVWAELDLHSDDR